jgi:hypothetical protein
MTEFENSFIQIKVLEHSQKVEMYKEKHHYGAFFN